MGSCNFLFGSIHSIEICYDRLSMRDLADIAFKPPRAAAG